jgi:hypothetical protein
LGIAEKRNTVIVRLDRAIDRDTMERVMARSSRART